MSRSSLSSVVISLLMSSSDNGGEPVVKVVRAITDPTEARFTCEALNTESSRLSGKLDAIDSLLESWSNHHPFPNDGTDQQQIDRQNAFEAERNRLRDVVFGADKVNGVPFWPGEVPHYWIETTKLD